VESHDKVTIKEHIFVLHLDALLLLISEVMVMSLFKKNP
jgi:hypothetical protein